MSDTLIVESDGPPRSNWRDAVQRFGSRGNSQRRVSSATEAGAVAEASAADGHVRALDGSV